MSQPCNRCASVAQPGRLDESLREFWVGNPWEIVRHGHIDVNGRRVNIPSYQVSAGDEIQVREKAKKFTVIEGARDYSSHQPVVAWLEVDRDNLKGRVLALPKREDINAPVNEQLIVELYSK